MIIGKTSKEKKLQQHYELINKANIKENIINYIQFYYLKKFFLNK